MKPETNYIPGSISFAEGFLGPKGDVGFFMKADYPKAKEILEKLIKSGKKITSAEMGLDGDWMENHSIIYKNGQHSEYNAWGGSDWAEPIMLVYFEDSPNEKYSVWKKKEK